MVGVQLFRKLKDMSDDTNKFGPIANRLVLIMTILSKIGTSHCPNFVEGNWIRETRVASARGDQSELWQRFHSMRDARVRAHRHGTAPAAAAGWCRTPVWRAPPGIGGCRQLGTTFPSAGWLARTAALAGS